MVRFCVSLLHHYSGAFFLVLIATAYFFLSEICLNIRERSGVSERIFVSVFNNVLFFKLSKILCYFLIGDQIKAAFGSALRLASVIGDSRPQREWLIKSELEARDRGVLQLSSTLTPLSRRTRAGWEDSLLIIVSLNYLSDVNKLVCVRSQTGEVSSSDAAAESQQICHGAKIRWSSLKESCVQHWDVYLQWSKSLMQT